MSTDPPGPITFASIIVECWALVNPQKHVFPPPFRRMQPVSRGDPEDNRPAHRWTAEAAVHSAGGVGVWPQGIAADDAVFNLVLVAELERLFEVVASLHSTRA